MSPPGERRVVPLPGSAGYTVATERTVAFIAHGDEIAQSVLEGILRRPVNGAETADLLVGVLASDASLRYPAIAAVIAAERGHEIVVSGGLEVIGSGPAGTGRWTAADSVPLRRPVGELHAVTIGAVRTGSIAGIDDLRHGTVASDGVVVTWTPSGADAEGAVETAWWRIPPSGQPVEPPPGPTGQPVPSHSTRSQGERTPVATLVFDDGGEVEIADDVVVGRVAGHDPRVIAGTASPVVPSGDTAALSRSHAWLTVRGRRIELVDLGARNGTFVWDVGLGRWERIGPGMAVALVDGDLVGFARRAARLDAPWRHRFRTGATEASSNPVTSPPMS